MTVCSKVVLLVWCESWRQKLEGGGTERESPRREKSNDRVWGLFLVLSMCARQRYTYIIIAYKLLKILSR